MLTIGKLLLDLSTYVCTGCYYYACSYRFEALEVELKGMPLVVLMYHHGLLQRSIGTLQRIDETQGSGENEALIEYGGMEL